MAGDNRGDYRRSGWRIGLALVASGCFGSGRADVVGVITQGGAEPAHSAASGGGAGTESVHSAGSGGGAGAEPVHSAGSGGVAGNEAGGDGGAEQDPAETVWAVGAQGKIWLRTEEKRWEDWESPTDKNLNALWGSAADDIWAVGDEGVLLHFDGEWARVELAEDLPNLRAIHGRSATDVWAVGDGGAVLRWNGSRWNRIESPTTQNLRSVRAVSKDEVWVGGPVGGILEWDGTRLRERSISAAPLVIDRLWHSNGGPVWALADYEVDCTDWEDDEQWGTVATYVLRKERNGWVERFVSAGGTRVATMFGLAEDDIWFLGYEDFEGWGSWAYRWDGVDMGRVEARDGEYPIDRMWGTDPEHLWVVTQEGISRLLPNGTVSEGSMRPYDLWGPGPVSGGRKGDYVRSVEDYPRIHATGCREEGCEAGVCDLTNTQGGACFCLGPNHEEDGECVKNTGCEGEACSGHGSCVEVDGEPRCECDSGYLPQEPARCGIDAAACSAEGWCIQAEGLPQAQWYATWASGPDDVWVVGEADYVFGVRMIVAHRGPSGWSVSGLEGPGSSAVVPPLVDISGTGPDDVWILSGRVHHFDGQSWAPLEIDAGAGLVGAEGGELQRIYAASPSEVWVAGIHESIVQVPLLYKWDGAQWWNVRVGDIVWQDQICGSGIPFVDDQLVLDCEYCEYGAQIPQQPQQELDALGLPPLSREPALEPAGVAVAGEDDVYVVGGTRIAHYDGTDWTEEKATPMPPTLMRLEAARDGTGLWALGGSLWDTVVGVGDGFDWTWSTVPACERQLGSGAPAEHVGPHEISAPTSELAFGFCDDDVAVGYDGSAWAALPVDLPSRVVETFDGIVATSAADVWLTGLARSESGSTSESFAAHWDGAHWQLAEPEPGARLGPLAVDSDSGLWAVGRDDPRIARFDGGAWVFEEFEGLEFERILASSARSVWAVAPDKLVHWDGEDWTIELDEPPLNDVWIDAEGLPWVAADEFVLHYDGDGWVRERLPAGIAATHISATQDRIWVGGYGYPFASRPLN
ncbi:MAG: hypothetical protein JW940_12305 [Polyangiaceae bacterium]|nr:hypothetical protein [Polyangiaceae bacterium]